MSSGEESDGVVRRQQVMVTDFEMPFGSMVVFMVKWVIASIPAMAVLLVLAWVVSAITMPRP